MFFGFAVANTESLELKCIPMPGRAVYFAAAKYGRAKRSPIAFNEVTSLYVFSQNDQNQFPVLQIHRVSPLTQLFLCEIEPFLKIILNFPSLTLRYC